MPCPRCGYSGDNILVKVDKEGYRWVVRCFNCDEFITPILREKWEGIKGETKSE